MKARRLKSLALASFVALTIASLPVAATETTYHFGVSPQATNDTWIVKVQSFASTAAG